jgi:hypothetical protein
MGVFVANDRVERAAKVRQGERIGGGPVKDQEHFAISLENLADLSNQAPAPSIVSVRNFRLGIRLRERGPGRGTDGGRVVARKIEAFFRRGHSAFPYATSSQGAIADRLPARRQRKSPGEKVRLSPGSARLILYPASLTSMCNRAAEKTKARSESEPPEATAECTPTPPVARFALSISCPSNPFPVSIIS